MTETQNVERPNDLAKAQGFDRARLFMSELLESVETLTGLAEEHGVRSLVDIIYLQNAILTGGFIDAYPGESSVLEIVRSLPSADLWTKYIKVEYLMAFDTTGLSLNDIAGQPVDEGFLSQLFPLVTAAAMASEVFSEDELEEHARSRCS